MSHGHSVVVADSGGAPSNRQTLTCYLSTGRGKEIPAVPTVGKTHRYKSDIWE